jgi:hypothetical protein
VASQGPLPATFSLEVDFGCLPWTNLAGLFDGSGANTSAQMTGGPVIWDIVRLCQLETPAGDNKSDAAALPGTDTFKNFGAANDTWAAGFAVSVVNSTGFGVFMVLRDSSDSWPNSLTNPLVGHAFGFTIPAGSMILGYEVSIEGRFDSGNAFLSEVTVTVTYTAPASSGGGRCAQVRSASRISRTSIGKSLLS